MGWFRDAQRWANDRPDWQKYGFAVLTGDPLLNYATQQANEESMYQYDRDVGALERDNATAQRDADLMFGSQEEAYGDRLKALRDMSSLPTADSIYQASQQGLGTRYSQAAGSRAAAMASRGMAGSGFQNRAMLGLRQDQNADRSRLRQDAISQWNNSKLSRENEAWGLQQQLDEKRMNKQAADETRAFQLKSNKEAI